MPVSSSASGRNRRRKKRRAPRRAAAPITGHRFHMPVTAAPAPAIGNPNGLWHFNHTHPKIPGILNVVVQAPTLQEGRAAAYLLAEAFTQNVIGFIRANAAAQLPPGFPAA